MRTISITITAGMLGFMTTYSAMHEQWLFTICSIVANIGFIGYMYFTSKYYLRKLNGFMDEVKAKYLSRYQ